MMFQIYPNKLLLKIHKDKHCEKNKGFGCDFCDMKYSSEKSLERHMSRGHNSKSLVVETLATKLKTNLINCPSCDRQFYRFVTLIYILEKKNQKTKLSYIADKNI